MNRTATQRPVAGLVIALLTGILSGATAPSATGATVGLASLDSARVALRTSLRERCNERGVVYDTAEHGRTCSPVRLAQWTCNAEGLEARLGKADGDEALEAIQEQLDDGYVLTQCGEIARSSDDGNLTRLLVVLEKAEDRSEVGPRVSVASHDVVLVDGVAVAHLEQSGEVALSNNGTDRAYRPLGTLSQE